MQTFEEILKEHGVSKSGGILSFNQIMYLYQKYKDQFTKEEIHVEYFPSAGHLIGFVNNRISDIEIISISGNYCAGQTLYFKMKTNTNQ